jgi:sugar lactone lactonase YvrE
MVAQAAAPNLMAAFFVKDKVGLKWSLVDGATEYLVFRKESGGEFTQIASVNDDHYFDTAIKGGTTYIYKVAIVENGSQVFSGEKSVATAQMDKAFGAPVWSGAREENRRVMLKWDKVSGAIAYNIWRSETSGGPYETIGTAQTNRFADNKELTGGVTYYYVVSALNDEFDETPQSEEIEVKYGLSAAEREEMANKANAIVLEPVSVTQMFLIDINYDGRPLEQPADLALAPQGDIYILDSLHGAIECYSSEGSPKFSFGSAAMDKESPNEGEFLLPLSIAVDSKGQVYVGDVRRNDIQVFEAGGNYIRTITVRVSGEQEALRPNGLDVLDDGRLVVTDAGNHRWLLLSPSGEILVESPGRGAGDGQLNFPDQILVAGNEVYVVDSMNCRIQVFDLEGNYKRKFGEIGQGAGQFGRPKGIGQDEKGRIWVTDGMSNLLQAFTQEGDVKSVLGAADGELRFYSPRGIQFVDGKMLVIERLHHRVTVFSIGS